MKKTTSFIVYLIRYFIFLTKVISKGISLLSMKLNFNLRNLRMH